MRWGPYSETGLGILLLFWLLVFMGYWAWKGLAYLFGAS